MWKQEFEKGKEHLFSLQIEEAIGNLNTAMEHCPVENSIELSEILFFMGMAFRSIGQSEYAYRCWENSAMLRDKDSDDIFDLNWKAFYRIQLIKYLSAKRHKQFGTLAESDFINDLIRTAWEEVQQYSRLKEIDFHQRCSYFRSIDIMFPYELDSDEDFRGKRVGHIVTFSTKKQHGGKK